jgi:eukaryotic-like serine/threonine-protein kinase
VHNIRYLSGREVAGWKLGRQIGEGADGVVYGAERGAERAAVKIYTPESIQKNGYEEQLQRLELQLQFKGKKQHDNLVEIIDGGVLREYETLYLVMELVAGASLDKVVGVLPRECIEPLLRQLVSAARFLHEKGIVHRDIKPSNIMISDDFKTLTLLDFGVIFLASEADSERRLSGENFVASLRYSPPEFVWRIEEVSEVGSLEAITFYQIGATLYDMIMRKPLFSGHDKPAARLFEAVRLHTPDIVADDVDPWLIALSQSCLIKTWRDRINLVSWLSFEKPTQAGGHETENVVRALRLRQIRQDERRMLAEVERQRMPHAANRVNELWEFQGALFLQLRSFLINGTIFPKCSASQKRISDGEYLFEFAFEPDLSLSFVEAILVLIRIRRSATSQHHTELLLTCDQGERRIFSATWTEIFTVDAATNYCQNALFQVADRVIPQ